MENGACNRGGGCGGFGWGWGGGGVGGGGGGGENIHIFKLKSKLKRVKHEGRCWGGFGLWCCVGVVCVGGVWACSWAGGGGSCFSVWVGGGGGGVGGGVGVVVGFFCGVFFFVWARSESVVVAEFK